MRLTRESRFMSRGTGAWSGPRSCARCATTATTICVLRTHAEFDLTEQAAVREFLARDRPQVVIIAAARVGGIQAKQPPALFIRDNLRSKTM